MTAERRFPVLAYGRGPGAIASVPWSLVEPHRDWARLNHGQTLERLAERGGLCPVELWMVIHGHAWCAPSPSLTPSGAHITAAEAEAWLRTVAGDAP